MAYCTVEDLRRILPDKVTIGNRNIGSPVPGRSGGTTRDSVSEAQAKNYIELAQQRIDSRLLNFYVTPLRRIKQFETELEANVNKGTDVNIVVADSGVFGLGDLIRIQDNNNMETTTIKSITNLTTFVVDSLARDYAADDSIVSILEFPAPIPITTSRIACSIILDRLYVSSQSPDISNYGKTQMNLANGSIESILNGEILLFGQEHSGRRFIRGSLLDAYKSPAEITKGQERE